MDKGDKILMEDGAILEFVGKTLPAGNALRFLWRFEALDKHRYAEMSFESAMTCRIAYLEHRIRAMELGVPGFWLHDMHGKFTSQGRHAYIKSEKELYYPDDLLIHYIYKDGKWVEDGDN